jgi:hypothetical protein
MILKNKKNLLEWLGHVLFVTLCILVLLQTSCTEEIIDDHHKPGIDKMVAVRFTLGDLNYKGNEVVTRTSPPAPLQEREEEIPFEGEPETVVVPLGEGLSMVVSLEEDQDVRTRTTSSKIPPGTMLRIVAYEDGNIYGGHEDYTVGNDANFHLIGKPLLVPEGDYTFVAYTFMYNSEVLKTMPHNDVLMNLNVHEDFVWGRFPNDGKKVTIDEHTNTVIHITMSHEFSGAKFSLSTEDIGNLNITHIKNVSVSGKQANLSVINGTFLPNSQPTSYYFPDASFIPINVPMIVSDTTILVHTDGANSTILKIDSLTLDGNKKFGNLTAAFDKQLKTGYKYWFKVKFQRDQGIEKDDKPPANLLMYVGAFWKADQTGERLIRIRRPTTGTLNAADGAWNATVIVGGEWIVLDTKSSDDQQVWTNNPTSSGNVSGFDATYAVNSTSRTVTGTMDLSNPQIYFRIGLTSKYVATPDHPVRYGVVMLTYKNNALKHRIWIRQGEEADYLICNGAPVCTDPTHGSAYLAGPRTVTKRFTPYNLTADLLDQAVMSQADASITPALPGNRSRFTDYPSQAGAFFQWSQHAATQTFVRTRWAWNPHISTIPTSPPTQTWQTSAASGYWDAIKANQETCPPGYRRPNDGLTNGPEDGNHIQISELRQSLFEHPKKGENYANDPTNNVYGYYADGFFDRRLITIFNSYSSVATGTKDVAYAGRVFYNAFTGYDHANASLFFPDAGFRDHRVTSPSGILTHMNPTHQTGYWTSSARTDNNDGSTDGIVLLIRNTEYASPWYLSKADGQLIRCVKEE